MKTVTKFYCAGVQDTPEYESQIVDFNAVTTGSEENKSFAKYTPTGSLSLTISKETTAYNSFVPHKEYYIVIEEIN